jgi:mannose-6-phosphate isomerase-like protein (cupin superfamily)
VHVPDKVAEGAGRFKADWSFDLVAREDWSAHVHVIPQGQLVPPHRHPDNDELMFVAAGRALWQSWTRDGPDGGPRGVGSAVVAAAGVVHSVRNREPELLATLVIQRPEFGQNWYLLPDEVESMARSVDFLPGGPAPAAFAGWTLSWSEAGTVPAGRTDTLLLVERGEGAISFEETTLPLKPGTFVKVPPDLAYRIEGDTVRMLVVAIPRE